MDYTYFKKDFFLITKKLSPSKSETKEEIEQFRCLDAGIKIQTLEKQGKMLSVDTQNDFNKIIKISEEYFRLGFI